MSRAATLIRFCRILGLVALLALIFGAASDAQTTGGGTTGGGTTGGGTTGGGGGPPGGTQGTTTNLNTSELQGAFGISSSGGQASSAYKMGTSSRNAATSTANPISQFYGNPLSYGASGTTTSGGSFGTPLYDSATGTTGARSGGTFANTTRTGGATTRTGSTGTAFGSTAGRTGTTGTTFGGTTGGFGGTTAGRTGGTTGGFGGTTGGFGGTTGGFGGTTAGRTGGTTALGGAGGLGNTLGGRNTLGGMTNNNTRRSTPYTMSLAEGLEPLPIQATPVTVARMQPDLQAVFQRSTAFATPANIKVGTEGGTVVLQGSVSSRRERQLAEAMIRLTPGVREVRNELEVAETAPAPRPIQ